MSNIINVVFENGESMSFDAKPLVFLDTDTDDIKYQKRRERNIEIRRFQRSILKEMDYQIVEDWAKDEFDLIEESESVCHDVHLDTCKDSELIEEATDRGLMNRFNQTILNQDFEKRFAKIVERENAIEIERWLSDMENRLRIVG